MALRIGYCYVYMDVGRGELDLDIFSKKRLCSYFEWEKSTFTTLPPPLEKFRKNPLAPP